MYSKEQMAVLSQYEINMKTALDAAWSRAMGRKDLQIIHDIYNAATGSNEPLNTNCSACTLRLLSRAGAIYFAQKDPEAALKKKKTK